MKPEDIKAGVRYWIDMANDPWSVKVVDVYDSEALVEKTLVPFPIPFRCFVRFTAFRGEDRRKWWQRIFG